MAGVAGALGACHSPPRGFDSPDPSARMDAVVDAARRKDTGAVPKIVPLLESDDPATRLVSIRALEQLTGRTLGYDYAASEASRHEAVGRWREFVGSGGHAGEAGASERP
jgi:hypothetical protein